MLLCSQDSSTRSEQQRSPGHTQMSDRRVCAIAQTLKTNRSTCGVSSLACFTAAWIPSTVLLLAVPTAAAFSAVAPSRPAWASKFPARSSKTCKHQSDKAQRFVLLFCIHLHQVDGGVVYVTDLLPVGGIGRSGGSHSQQFDGGGGVAEDVGHFLGHHLLHVLPQVLAGAECVVLVH